MIRVLIRTADFDAGKEIALLSASGGGAVASFVGQVRGDDAVALLSLEHYPAMTQTVLEKIAEEAVSRWSLRAATIVHRVGDIPVGAQIMFCGAAADHRADALAACTFLIDRLKTDAPFWKKEIAADGSEQWVEQREADLARGESWDR
ncbi:MAG: molybdenum cofactor biosynthesis protein MoaE [Parasphingorhabdus sp.]|nr:molybdenum cofactor biosynthesis protein MoaE [Parasphingorhabdus sp.]